MEIKLDHISKHDLFRFILNFTNLYIDNGVMKYVSCENIKILAKS